MAHRSYLSRIGTQSLGALLALFTGACGTGADATPATGVQPFSGALPSSPLAQPATTGQATATPGTETTPDANDTSGSSPENQAGDLPLNAGSDTTGDNPGAAPTGDGTAAAPATPASDAMTPPATTPPATTPPAMTPPATTPDAPAPPSGVVIERPTKGTTDLFTTLIGKTPAEVDDKLSRAVNLYFGIGTNESPTPVVNQGYRVYYELPQDPSMAFIWAADSNDIRSEGMSYGMFISVQMDMQPQFDRLWKFARTYMQFAGNANPATWRSYFRWQGSVNTGNAQNWGVNFGAQTGPAPDGDQYFATALYLAARRWGNNGGTNYKQEADNIAHAMLTNAAAGGNTPLFQQNLPVFFPSGNNATFTDPSYNLPAFYELFALDGPQGDSARWRQMANTSRALFVSSANAQTGLHPDYANFNGTPNNGGSNHDTFRYDAWRVVMNMAIDYSWFSQDARERTQVEKYHAFFGNHLAGNNVDNALFALNGSGASGGGSTALTSTLASGALASQAANRTAFVQAAWDVAQQSGQYRYYQESVYLLGLLASSGVYGYEWAQ